jgi:hypothetical protein
MEYFFEKYNMTIIGLKQISAISALIKMKKDKSYPGFKHRDFPA